MQAAMTAMAESVFEAMVTAKTCPMSEATVMAKT
jgi:hypothetical protein